MTYGALLAKDARLLLRNRALLAALLLYPVLLAATLAAAFQEPPATLDLAVWNGDEGGSGIDVGGERIDSTTLVAQATAYARVRNHSTEERAIAAVRRGDADAALLIPQGFVQELSTLGGNATLHIIVDESDPVRAGVARSAVTGGVDAFLRAVVQRKVADVENLLNLTVTGGTTRFLFIEVDVMGIDRARAALDEVHRTLDPQSPEARKVDDVIAFLDFARGVLGNAGNILRTTALPIDTQARGLTSTSTPISAIALPGALVLGVFWTGALAAALLAARERETGTARRLAAAPGARRASAAAKATAAMLAAMLPATLLLLLATLLADAIIQNWPLTLLVLLAASLAAAALGALAAGLARNTSAATLLAVLLLVPMLLLGGLFYPVAYMPAPAQALARLLPVTTATDALRGAMLRGNTPTEIALPLLALLGFAAAAGGIAWGVGRRSGA